MDFDKNILVIDDEANMRHMLAALLTEAGYHVDTAGDGAEGVEKLRSKDFRYIFCDIKMPNMDGMQFLETAAPFIDETNVIMMSAYGTIDTAVEAMKRGAYDYISKPFKTDEVLLALKKAEERERLKMENRNLRQRIEHIAESNRFGNMVAESQKMKDVFKLAVKVAKYDTTVLIIGESGTGKELIARGIHFASERAKNPMIPINCGGIPENLLESELFGHKKGAFTGADKDAIGLFEAAQHGTIFLDEVGELPLALQVKLLRVLQENEIRPVGASVSKKIDVRVIAATSKDLKDAVARGEFREDLYYRLNVMPIDLPPLVERSEDIPLLCRFFIDRYAEKFEKPVGGIAPSAMSRLLSYPWPGNVRELENLIERAVVLAESDRLGPEHFPSLADPDNCRDNGINTILSGFSLKSGKETLERILIRKALAATDGNRTQAARLLEISHPSLLSKMKAYEIE